MAEGGLASKVLDAVEAKVNGIDARLEELDAQLIEAQAAEDKATEEFTESVSRELKAKMDSFTKGFKHNAEDRFINLENRYGDHADLTTRAAQTDVLRLNKITRDVSRVLGADWKNVFSFIMAGCDKALIDSEIQKIEKQKPVMQAYKAIMRWRDIKSEDGSGVDVDKLIEALQVWDKAELADHVKAILYSEGEELLQIGTVGKGIPTGAAASASADGDDSGAAAARPVASKSSADSDTTGPIPDRKLLQLAKKIGPSWFELATLLGLAEEDISDVKGSEGMTYQGAFKVIWLWRDRTLDEDIDQRQVLKEALNACSMTDVAEIV